MDIQPLPALLMITSDLRAFMTSYERNEGYTDGGLFGMSLLLSLESLGIGACPLNTMFTATAEKKTRKLLHLPDNEVPVMYYRSWTFLGRNTYLSVHSIPRLRYYLGLAVTTD